MGSQRAGGRAGMGGGEGFGLGGRVVASELSLNGRWTAFTQRLALNFLMDCSRVGLCLPDPKCLRGANTLAALKLDPTSELIARTGFPRVGVQVTVMI